MTQRTDRRTVRVTTSGPTITISPATSVLGDLRVGRLEVGGGGGLVGVNMPLFRLVRKAGGGFDAVAWAGLAAVVVGLLKANGVPVSVAAPDAFSLTQAGGTPWPLDPAVVALPRRTRRALVRYGGAVDPLNLAAQLVAAAGTKNGKVVVLVRSRREGSALRRHLIATAAAAQAVSVCTLGTSGLAGLEEAGLVLVLDALHATWADPLTAEDALPVTPTGFAPAVGLMDRLGGLPAKAAVVGFLPVDRTLSPFETARAWQIYGPDELVVPAHGVVVRPVGVAVHRVGLGRRLSRAADALAVKNGLWRDPVRNRRLAALARAVATGDDVALRAAFPAIVGGGPGTGPRSVLVLCEGLDQAEFIAGLLPGWPVVTGRDEADAAANPAGRPIGVNTVIATAYTVIATAYTVIATALGVRKLPGGDFDVVVRADPGHGLPPLPPGWAHGRTLRPLLVVEADDAGHPLARRWSRQRRAAHLAAGWPVVGTDRDLFAWHRFCALVLHRGASA